MFCPKCDSVLVPIKQNGSNNKERTRKLRCVDCKDDIDNEEFTNQYIFRETISHDVDTRIEIVNDKEKFKISKDLREELWEEFRESRINQAL